MYPRLPIFGGGLRLVYLFLIAAGLLAWRLFSGFAPLDTRTANRRFFEALLWGLLAARFVEYLIFLPQYLGLGSVQRMITYQGLAFWPGLAAGLGALWRRAAKNNEKPWELVAAALYSLTAALAVVWLGALVDGTAFGTPSELPWALNPGMYTPGAFIAEYGPAAYAFNPGAMAAFRIHPVQAYFMAACLSLFAILPRLRRRLGGPRAFSAVVVGVLALLWLALGFFRNDNPVLLLGLRAPQLQALGGLVWSAIILLGKPGNTKTHHDD